MIINTKKADSQIWWILIIAFVAIVVGILVTLFFGSGLDKVKATVYGSVDSLGDTDKDKVPDFQDKCPCTAALIQSKLLPGCPKDTTEAVALKDMEKFSSTGCKTAETGSSSSSPASSTTELSLNLKDSTGKVFSGSVYETSDKTINYDLVCPSKCTLSFVQKGKSSPDEFTKEYGAFQGSDTLSVNSVGNYILSFKDDKKTISSQITKK